MKATPARNDVSFLTRLPIYATLDAGMINDLHTHVRRKWKVCPREEKATRWSTLYVTVNKEGDIWLNRAAHEAMGSPDAVFLLFDEATQVIGLKTAHPGQKNAYPCAPRGKHGGRRVRALRLCRDFGIYVPHTLFFHASHIDKDGVLILDLKHTRPSSRRHRIGY